MTKDEKSQAAAQPETPAVPPVEDEEAKINARINELQTSLVKLKNDIRTMQGRIENRNPDTAKKLEAENMGLRTRLVLLEKAFYGVIMESTEPRSADEANQLFSIFKNTAIEYFKKVNISPDLWKNIASS